jgi:hypothetical protein
MAPKKRIKPRLIEGRIVSTALSAPELVDLTSNVRIGGD